MRTLAQLPVTNASKSTLAVTEARFRVAADYHSSTSGEALVVMRDGKILFEQYDGGGTVNHPQMLASGSKSFAGLAPVMAVEDKILKLDAPASEAITEWKTDPVKSKITYRQLLTLTSGLTAGERGGALRSPAWKTIADKPMTGSPGGQFDYGAFQINSFAYALERKLQNETFEAYLKRRLLVPLGVTVEWRFRCADRHPQVGGGAFMTARDWAKLGEFVRLNGKANGKSIVNATLLQECFQGSKQNPAYGLAWWLKKPVPGAIVRAIPLLALEWGGVANSDWLPNDMVAACGAGKQRLYVIPSLKLVIARQGKLSQRFEDSNFLNLLLRNVS